MNLELLLIKSDSSLFLLLKLYLENLINSLVIETGVCCFLNYLNIFHYQH